MTYIRKTRDLFTIQSHTCMGWEAVSYEDNRADAKRCLKDYRDNQPAMSHRIVKTREKINA